MAKTLLSFGHSECDRVKIKSLRLERKFFQELSPIENRGRSENGSVVSPESASIHFKNCVI